MHNASCCRWPRTFDPSIWRAGTYFTNICKSFTNICKSFTNIHSTVYLFWLLDPGRAMSPRRSIDKCVGGSCLGRGGVSLVTDQFNSKGYLHSIYAAGALPAKRARPWPLCYQRTRRFGWVLTAFAMWHRTPVNFRLSSSLSPPGWLGLRHRDWILQGVKSWHCNEYNCRKEWVTVHFTDSLRIRKFTRPTMTLQEISSNFRIPGIPTISFQ